MKMTLAMLLCLIIFIAPADRNARSALAGEGKDSPAALSSLPVKISSPVDIDARVEELLKRMTIEEKAGQMNQFSEGVSPIEIEAMTGAQKSNQKEKDRDAREKFKILARKGLIGSLLNSTGAEHNNELQRIAVKESRLGIPIIYGYDVIHGYRTILPVPLGLAATWNPSIVERGARVAAVEASASGVHWTFSPMVDIARDPRWGRIVEGAGEDVYLGCAMARAQIRGYQGKSLAAPDSVAACAKHYVGYGAAMGGRDYNSTDISERSLREIYLPPFKAAADEQVATFMSAFNDLNGIPTSGNHYTLTEILRNEWQYRGFVVSDWESILQLIPHGFAGTRAQAGAEAVNAGVDMDMADGIYLECLPALVKEGKVSMATVDESVRRILRIKFQKGLFDHPYTDTKTADRVILSKEHKDATLAAAQESMVLLRNEGRLLPLAKNCTSLAVIGFLGNDRQNLMGSWSAQGKAADNTTILEEIKRKVGPRCTVTYAQGCAIDRISPQSDIDEAVKAARGKSAAILVLGERGDLTGEAASRTSLDLPADQQKLLEAVYATGTPVILVLMNGRPLTISWAASHVPAIMEAWFPGTMGGQAVADVIFGDYNPGGKLPVTFPRNVGQIPLFYNNRNTGRPASEKDKFTSKYIDSPNSPLYPFGYGLSYTDFAYGDLSLSSHRIAGSEKLTVAVTVKNTGSRKGDEVVQLYIHKPLSRVTRPVKELRAFQRIHLAPGESRKVTFTLGPDTFSSYDRKMKHCIDPGDYTIQVGGNSEKGLQDKVVLQ